MISSKIYNCILSFLFICDVSVWMVNCTSTTTRPDVTTTGFNETIKSEHDKFRGDPLTLQLIQNSSILLLNLHPREETLEITLTFDLELYKKSNYSKNRKMSNDVNVKENPSGLKPKKINLGFDSHEGKFVDVISISLLPFEETEKENHESNKVEQTNVHTIGNDHVQDFHWIKKDGLLLPDLSQSYDLVTFDVEKNQTIFSTTISRPWLTCDMQDIQFSFKPIEIWWMLEMTDSNVTQVKTSNIPKKSANLEHTSTTPASETSQNGNDKSADKNKSSGSFAGTSSTTDATTIENTGNNRTLSKNITLIDKNVTAPSSGGRNLGEEAPKTEEVEVFKSIKDHDFQGPVILSMEKLLSKFSSVLIKNCPTVNSMKKKSPTQLVFNCTLKEYKKRQDIQAHLRIAGVVSLESSLSSSSSSTRKTFTEIEPEPCPTSFDNNTTTLYNALTGGNTLHPNKKKNGRESASRNSVTTLSNFPFSNYQHSALLVLVSVIFPNYLITTAFTK